MRVHAYGPGTRTAVTRPDAAGETRLRELVIIEADEAVYQVGGHDEIDIQLTVAEIFGDGPGHVIVHSCREIIVTVDYTGKSVIVKAPPPERVGDIHAQAVRELRLDPAQSTDLVLRLPGTTEELPDDAPVGAYVPKGTCALTLDLVHAVRPQG